MPSMWAARHAHDIKNAVVTAGYIKEKAREVLLRHNAANVDLKAFTESFYVARTAELGAARHAKYLYTKRRLVRNHDPFDSG